MNALYRLMGVILGFTFLGVGLSAIDSGMLTFWSRYHGAYITAEGSHVVWIGASMSFFGLLSLAHSASETRWFRLTLIFACLGIATVIVISFMKTV
jgi:hypothetical protein